MGDGIESVTSKMQIIPFKKDGYDPFINFLKAYSIVCVVLAHSIPHKAFDYLQFMVWGDMQVPMFILIQTFHSYKSGKQPSFNVRKVWSRIMLPFLIVQIAILILLLFFSSSSLETIIHDTWVSGGNGPGSYYVWIYLQIAFILPLLYPLFNKLSRRDLLMVFIIACVSFECLFSILCLPQPIYRLLSVRYLFLIYLGMTWVDMGGVKMSKVNLLFSVLSILAVEFFVYNKSELEPFFFTTGWKTHRWICYYYVAFLMPVILYMVFVKTNKYIIVNNLYKEVGQSSYEIYLMQMAVFVILPSLFTSFMQPGIIRSIALFSSELTLSILLGVLFRIRISPLLERLS